MSDNDVPVTTESEEEARSVGRSGRQSRPATATGVGSPRRDELERRRASAKLAALDEALAKFTAQKRWSDVIKTTLAEGRARARRRRRRSRCSRDAGAHVPRALVEPGRGDQVLPRACSTIDRSNLEAIDAPQGHVREAPRLGEAGRGACAPSASCSTPATSRCAGSRWRELATEQAAQARRLHRAVAATCSRSTRGNAEAIDGARRACTSARASGAPLAEVLERRPSTSSDEAELVHAAAEARRDLRRQAATTTPARSRVQAPARARARTIGARRSSSRSATSPRARGTTLEAFYATTDKWDELIRTLERAGDDAKESEPRSASRCCSASRGCGTRRRTSADRAARAYEKVLGARRPATSSGRGADADLRAGGRRQEARLRLRGAAQAHRGRRGARRAAARDRPPLRGEAAQPAAGVRQVPRGVRARPDAGGAARGPRAPRPARPRTGTACSPRTRRRSTAPAHADDANDLRLYYGQVLARPAASTTRSSSTARSATTRATTGRDPGARARCTGRPRTTRSCSRCSSAAPSSRTIREARKQLAYDIARLLRRAARRRRQGDRGVPQHPGRVRRGRDRGVPRARAALRSGRSAGTTWPRRSSTASISVRAATRSWRRSSSGWPSVLRKHLGDKARALELLPRGADDRARARGRARARSRACSPTRSSAHARRASSSRSTRARGDWEKLVQALEVSLGSIGDGQQRVDVITRIGEIYAEQIGDRASAFDAYCRALREVPENPGIARAARGAGQGAEQAPADGRGDRRAGRRGRTIRLLGSSCGSRPRSCATHELGDVDGAVAAYMQALELDEADVEIARRARVAVPAHRALARPARGAAPQGRAT